MKIQQLAKDLRELLHSITAMGPIEPAFDGLRVFQHPLRMVNFFTGFSTQVVPLTVDLWPSIVCNSNCPLCQYRLSGARTEAERNSNVPFLSEALAKEILLGISEMGVRTIIFTGGGEPLMNPNLLKLVSLARVFGLNWGLVTNGTLLSHKMIHDLLAEKPAFLRVSVDSGSADRYAQVYGVKEATFHSVVKNVLNASHMAKRLNSTALGISFTLDSDTDTRDLINIQTLLKRITNEGEGGLKFVAFRPRLLQYKNIVPVCPQPGSDKFPKLADAIREYIVNPLSNLSKCNAKLDVKDGLFRLAARKELPRSCLSGAWMTTISQTGIGYITGELAGASICQQDWGKLSKAGDFREMWFGKTRICLHQQLENGQIQVPVVHRTTPIDECLQMVRKIVKEPLELDSAKKLLELITKDNWYRSLNGDFV